MSTTFVCDTCYDTGTIDQGGREIACPDCASTATVVDPEVIVCDPTIIVRLTGLGHGLGMEGKNYRTADHWTPSTIVFIGTAKSITRDVATVRASAILAAHLAGHSGRNHVSSGAIAIERRVLAALKGQS